MAPLLEDGAPPKRSNLADFGIGLGIMLAVLVPSVFILCSFLLAEDDPIGCFLIQVAAMMLGGFLATRSQSRRPVINGGLIVLAGYLSLFGMLVVFDAFLFGVHFPSLLETSPQFLLSGFVGVLIARAVFVSRWEPRRK